MVASSENENAPLIKAERFLFPCARGRYLRGNVSAINDVRSP